MPKAALAMPILAMAHVPVLALVPVTSTRVLVMLQMVNAVRAAAAAVA